EDEASLATKTGDASVALVPQTVRVVAIHPPTAAQIDPPQLEVAAYGGLETAFAERRAVVAKGSSSEPWLDSLYGALGFEMSRPLAVIPLYHQARALGLLMLGGPGDLPAWRETALEGPVLASEVLAEAIASSKAKGGTGPLRTQTLSGEPRTETKALDFEREKLVEAVALAKQQIAALNGRIRTLVEELKARDEEILALNSELESRTPVVSETELSVWQDEVRQLADERETLQRRLKELTRDRDVLLEERARLSERLIDTKETLDRVEAHRERLEEEVATLQEAVERQSSPHPTELQAERVSSTTEKSAEEQGAVGLVIADEDGHIIMADALARQMLKLPAGDAVGVHINAAYPAPEWAQAVDRLLSAEEGEGRAHLSLSKDTSTVEADLVTLYGRDGKLDGLVVTLRSSESDIERYEAVVGLANDFRTPMTAITGYTDLLLGEQGGILTEMQQQFLERVKANIEQLNHLLNDLIEITSPDMRPIELSPEPVNLIEIIEEAIMGLAARFRERKLAVQLDLPSELSRVEVDRDSLYQIILRLLSNAVLCSEEGTQVIVSAQEQSFSEDGKHLRISVTDTGGGISADDYPRVFRRFYRANQPLVAGMGETGVGMAVAKTLVEANGGRIWVESEEGVGSTFSFLLPVKS
ncbi:MAG: ATP-binding protein, partial [Anaerolineae bacterium]